MSKNLKLTLGDDQQLQNDITISDASNVSQAHQPVKAGIFGKDNACRPARDRHNGHAYRCGSRLAAKGASDELARL